MQSHHILFVDFERELVVLTDGASIPITSYLDDEGDECGKNESTWCIAGDEAHGYTDIHFNQLQARVLH